MRPIDSVAISVGAIQCIEGCQLLEYHDIVMSDYKAYLIDFNLEEYFQEEFSTWNNINKSILNPSRKSHRAIFFRRARTATQYIWYRTVSIKAIPHLLGDRKYWRVDY